MSLLNEAELAAVRGPVLGPDDPQTPAETTGSNLAVLSRPALTVGATSADDVAAAISWGARRGLPIGVLATGHGAAVSADGGVLITTSRMNGVEVDPVRRTARIQAGVRTGQIIEAAAPHGLAPLVGSTSKVGTVGFVTGGGLSIVSRTFGFGADHVRGFEIVTADGRLRQVDAQSEPDLFWAVRGGRGNFGVVTSMELNLVPLTTLYGGVIFFAAEAVPAALHAYREWAPALPEATTTAANLVRLPALPFVPPPLAGKLTLGVLFVHTGEPAEGERLLEPMRRVAPPVIDTVAEVPYTSSDTISNDPPDPMPVVDRGCALGELTAEAVDRLLEVAGPGVELPLVLVGLRQMGGALRREPSVPNAVAGRDAEFMLAAIGVLAPEIAEVVPRTLDGVFGAMAPWSRRGLPLTFRGSAATSPEEVAETWPPEMFDRLRAIKRDVDPQNLFRIGHCIPPA